MATAVNNAGDTANGAQHAGVITNTFAANVPTPINLPRPADGQLYPRGDGVPTT